MQMNYDPIAGEADSDGLLNPYLSYALYTTTILTLPVAVSLD